MNTLFGTLEGLVSPVKTKSGREVDALSVYRLTLGQGAVMFETSDSLRRLAVFCDAGVRTADELSEAIDSTTLDAADAAELVSALVDMARPKETMTFEGDGVSHPIVFTLAHPVKLSDDITVDKFEFRARTLGEVAGFLNADGEVATFREFMRSFAGVVGVPMPVTDSLVNALDLEDYSNIKEHVLGKLAKSRGRLKKAS